MASRSEKMYSESPELKRDDDSGKMKVSKAEKKSARVSDGTDGMKITEEGLPPHVRQANERRDMYNRHETEHAVADNGKAEKKEIHVRHQAEIKDMHKRHEKSVGGGSGAQKIEKVTKGEK
ncbi:MAG: hypothetical protein WC100_01600 [Sterolibacterium sp.]